MNLLTLTTLLTLAVQGAIVSAGILPDPPVIKKSNPFLDSKGRFAERYEPTQVWFQDRRAWCYKFGDKDRVIYSQDGGATTSRVLVNPALWPTRANGRTVGRPIFDVIPTDDWYSDAWYMMRVIVPDSYKAGDIRDYQTLVRRGWPLYPVDFVNLPIVPKGSKLMDWSSPMANEVRNVMERGFYRNMTIWYLDFGSIPLDPALGSIPTSDLYQIQNTNGEPTGFPVISTTRNSANYTGFFTLKLFNTTELANGIRNDTNLRNNPAVVSTKTILNCPVVLSERNPFVGSLPGILPPPMTRLPDPPVFQGPNAPYFDGPAAVIPAATVYYNGATRRCWNFGRFSVGSSTGTQTKVAVGSVLYPVYKTSGFPAGSPVFGSLPTDTWYTDVLQVIEVQVPDSAVENSYTKYSDLINSGAVAIKEVRNLPIVYKESTLEVLGGGQIPQSPPTLKEGWYNGKAINFFDAGSVSLGPFGDLAAKGAVINSQNQTVVETVSGAPGHNGGFYTVGVVGNAPQNFQTYTQFDFGSITFSGGILNCPTITSAVP
ncbi:hypothetical protein HDV05_003818 [Chytridiales sp. JEL 0842]|nr:hypothetical protein HDV05_003818 [Chytridiales sp. JEL 0842]